MRSRLKMTKGISVVILTVCGVAQAGPNDCPPRQQRLDGVCVAQRVVDFIECLARTSQGHIRTTTYEKTVADRGTTTGVAVGLKLVTVGGKAQVTVDDRDVGQVVKAAEATFGEAVLPICRCLADPRCPETERKELTSAGAGQPRVRASGPAAPVHAVAPVPAPSATGICKDPQIRALAERAGLTHPPEPNGALYLKEGDYSYWLGQGLPCARIAQEFQARKAALDRAALTQRKYPTQGDLAADAQQYLAKSR